MTLFQPPLIPHSSGDGGKKSLGDTPNPGSILLHLSCHPSPFAKGGFQGVPESGATGPNSPVRPDAQMRLR